MKNIRNDKNEESGQSTVEFTLMLGILLFLLFLIFQAGVTYMTTQYIKYAAYLGARTYAVRNEEAGRFVIKGYLGARGGKLAPFIRPIEGKEFIEKIETQSKKEIGFRINYKSLFYFPFIGQGVASTGNEKLEEIEGNGFLNLNVKSVMKNESFNCGENDASRKKFDNRTGREDGC